MRISIDSIGDFLNTIKWLEKASTVNTKAVLEKVGARGVRDLKNATPKQTGGTAAGWSYKIQGGRYNSSLYFVNNAYMHLSVNLAMLIDSGHGTGTGGYVPAVNYIRPAIEPAITMAGDLMIKEVNGK